jgi:hypothetical protein
MQEGGELRDAAVLREGDEQNLAVHIMVRRGSGGLGVVMYMCRRVLPLRAEIVVMARTLPPGFSPVCLDPVTLLRAWCAGRRASFSQERRIVALLDVNHLERLPLPPRTIRRPGVPDWQWWRFLFRRHIQSILFWKGWRPEGSEEGFSDDVNWLIRVVLFPVPPTVLSSDGEHAGGGEGRGAEEVTGAVSGFIASRTSELYSSRRCLRPSTTLRRRATTMCSTICRSPTMRFHVTAIPRSRSMGNPSTWYQKFRMAFLHPNMHSPRRLVE